MRILVLEQRYTGAKEAGIGRYNLFVKEWAKAGHKVDVISGTINYLTGKKPDKYKRRFLVKGKEGENVRIFRVFEFALGYWSFLGRLFSYFSFLKSAFFVGLFISRPDIIIASSPPIFVGFLGYLICLFKKVPFIFEVRDIWPDIAIELGFFKNRFLIKISHWLEKFLYQHSDFIIVNSPGIKEFLIKEKSVAVDKIAIIFNPVDIKIFESHESLSLKEKFGWNDKFVVLYSGAHSAVYNLNLIIETAEELKFQKDILFVLVGDGRQKPILTKKVKEKKLENVLFFGAVSKEENVRFLKAADVCVCPLKEINLLKYVYATKIFDYMASKKSIILIMKGVSEELVCNQASCGLCLEPPGDKESFKRAILDFYENPDKIKRMEQKGFDYLKNHFNAENLAEKYLSVLNLINQTSSRTKVKE